MEFLKNKKVRVILISLGCLIILIIYLINKRSNDEESSVIENNVSINYDDLIVEIKGEVNKTGIYSVGSETRVNDVIILAGGLTINADTTNINLAEKVEDGMVIFIPSKKIEENESTLININTATKEELMKLNGIGEAKAQAIITYRNNNNGFKNIEELVKVNGISEKIYLSIKDKITV